MRAILAGVAIGACLITACSGTSSNFALKSASVDQSFTCPAGSSDAPYEIHASVDAHNGTTSPVTIKSASADLTLEAVKGPWLEKVGDKYQASKVTVEPATVAPGATASVKVTIPSACTNGKATNGASYGEYRVAVHIATSAGNFSISAKALHRLVAA